MRKKRAIIQFILHREMEYGMKNLEEAPENLATCEALQKHPSRTRCHMAGKIKAKTVSCASVPLTAASKTHFCSEMQHSEQFLNWPHQFVLLLQQKFHLFTVRCNSCCLFEQLNSYIFINLLVDKKLSYRRETARQLCMST